MGTTPVLLIPYPDGPDAADGPGAFQDLAERVEALGLFTETDVKATRQGDGSVKLEINDGVVSTDELDPYAVHDLGDFKDSAQTASHGRWLLCDVDRDMTPAEIVAECPGLSPGDADDLATLLGTGASSRYGTAAGGKVKVPGFGGTFPIVRSASHPEKGTGSAGGAESVTLSATEAGLKAHDHVATADNQTPAITVPNATPAITITDPGHNHTQNAHSHPVNITDPGHSHNITDPGHSHSVLVSTTLHRFSTNQGSGATIQPYGDAGTVITPVGGGATSGDGTGVGVNGNTTGITASSSNTTPTNNANTTGITAAQTAHTHAATQAAHSHAITVAHKDGEAASSAHENMPPYRVGGRRFIYV